MTKGRFGRDGSISLQRNENYCLTVVVVAIVGAAISVRGSVAVVAVVWLAVVASVVPVGFSFSFSLAK